MTSKDTIAITGSGEARTRLRKRRQITYIAASGVAGGIIGFTAGFFDQGDGSLFFGGWEDLRLNPAIAIALTAALLGALVAMPLYGFRMIDEHKREQNLIGMTGGLLSVLAGFPVWAVLYAGGFVPPPTAHGMFLIAIISTVASFLYAKWRV